MADFQIYEEREFARWLRVYVRPARRAHALADMVENQRRGKDMPLVLAQFSTLELRTGFRLRSVLGARGMSSAWTISR